MAWRQIISRILIVAVLAHAAAIVRHHIVMLGAHDRTQLAFSFSDGQAPICHSGATLANTDLDKTKPGTARKSCPICSGVAAVFALATPHQLVLPSPVSGSTIRIVEAGEPVPPQKHIRPPGRGPPIA